ncbi:NDUFB8 [Phaffia rhodozyma]|uniref:NDUFB8 n=1 Tax=Phaffia rhodozyma TaxID=264483 RepID=A0A0F7SNK5_PHARH|nr:NDUFB8 [Phaffia rhodozyma]
MLPFRALRASSIRIPAGLLNSQKRYVGSNYAPLNPLGDYVGKGPVVPNGKEPDPQLFGYPELPTEYTQLRDPRAGWWDPQERRNFGEFLQEEDEVLNVWSPEVNPHQSPRFAIYTFAGFFGFLYLYYQYAWATFEYPPMVAREFPHDGLLSANGGHKRNRYNVYRGIDEADVFEGSQREYYLGPKVVEPRKYGDRDE